MSNYLMTHYKGIYRLRAPLDINLKVFPREYTGQFAENDVYIDCQHKGQIFHYGKAVLQFYTPSKGRGRNIIKAIKEDFGDSIIYNIEETDSEVLFKFNSKYMTTLESYLQPKTNGADRSPFSTKNLPKTKYIIPDEDLLPYKEIVSKIPQNQLISLVHTTNSFLQSLATKKNTWENIKADMAIKGLKGKEYIHAIHKWNEYIGYIKLNL